MLQLTYVGALISVVDAQGAGEVAQLDGEGVEVPPQLGEGVLLYLLQSLDDPCLTLSNALHSESKQVLIHSGLHWMDICEDAVTRVDESRW